MGANFNHRSTELPREFNIHGLLRWSRQNHRNNPSETAHHVISPMSHISRRLLLPIFIANVGHNQLASRIVTLTFLTQSVNNESTFFVQRSHPYRAFLRNHIRTNFACSRDYRTVNLCSKLVLITKEQSLHLYTSSRTSGGSTQLLLLAL